MGLLHRLLRGLLLVQSFVLATASTTTALYLAHVTSVAYCQDERILHWNCQPCTLVARLEGVTVVEDAKDAFQGLVGYSPLYEAVVITFRGSMDVTNWLDNLTFLKTRAYKQFPDVLVHQGFYWAYRSVALQVMSAVHKLREQYPEASLMVAGHSLGGAVAAICAFELEYIEQIQVAALYTFGKPRVGNADFSARLRNASIAAYRLTHFQDIVPHLPPTWTGFEHTSVEIFYDQFSANYRRCSLTDGEDPTCSNTCSPFRCTSIVDHLTYLNITMSHLVC
uniref:Fungal lipase-type domain-containing protein n=1 Tax=Peronospora matthiolae TaxID=2874970 RepID=A0AAV1U7B8_9STRA